MNHGRSEAGSLSMAAIILSCLGVLSFGILAIPGVVCGHLARGKSERDHALGGAALIVGYSVLALFFGLPLLAILGMFVLSASFQGDASREFATMFPGFGSSEHSAVELEGGLSAAAGTFFTQYGPLLATAGLGLLLLVAAGWAAPRFGRWHQRRQLRKLVSMNRSR